MRTRSAPGVRMKTRVPMRDALRAMLLASLACALSGCGEPTEPMTRALPQRLDLSPGICPIIHCNRDQNGALPVAGPTRDGGQLAAEDIDHLWSSPIAGGVLDHVYPDGRRVLWVPQVDRIMKLELDADNRLRKLAELPLQPKKFPRFSDADMQRIVGELDSTPFGTEAYRRHAEYWHEFQQEGLRAYYAMVSNAGVLYVGNKDSVVAYGDAEPGNPSSGIVELGQYGFEPRRLQLRPSMPVPIMIGFNMTPDGHIVSVTMDGTLMVIAPDLGSAAYYTLKGEQIWNSVSVDSAGGLYVAGNRKLHKLVWKDGAISDSAEDGAWTEPYRLGRWNSELRSARGTGTTPVLMGEAGDRDRFVVIADGDDVNNVVLYWRDEIPADWQQLPGTPSRRVAGMLPVNFGNREMKSSYSENAAVVFDYGLVFGNNQAPSLAPMNMDIQLQMKDPANLALGLQKFVWNPAARRLEVGWSRPDVASPNCTPVVATMNRQIHTVGLRDGQWSMEALDWDSGATRAVYALGHSERFNPIMLALQLLPNGDPIYPAFGGIVHLRIGQGRN